jgi:hypothetical protein
MPTGGGRFMQGRFANRPHMHGGLEWRLDAFPGKSLSGNDFPAQDTGEFPFFS